LHETINYKIVFVCLSRVAMMDNSLPTKFLNRLSKELVKSQTAGCISEGSKLGDRGDFFFIMSSIVSQVEK
jgi:hypothetical protein